MLSYLVPEDGTVLDGAVLVSVKGAGLPGITTVHGSVLPGITYGAVLPGIAR